MRSWPLMKDIITEDDRAALTNHIRNSAWLTAGPKVAEFEDAWSEWLGCENSLMVSSGSTANFLILAAIKEKLGLQSGAKVIVPSTTWVTNIGPVMQLGLQPVFCDVGLETLGLSFEEVERTLNEQPDIRIVFVTHLLGLPAEIEKMKASFPEVIFLEDVCESHGANLGGRKCGTFGLASSFSFYFGHHMTTIEGGMVCTGDDDLADLMRAKRSHGFLRETKNIDIEKYMENYPNLDEKFTFITDGYNFRSTDLNATLGLSQLPRLDANIKQRCSNFARFIQLLKKYNNFFTNFVELGNSSFSLPFILNQADTKRELEKTLNDKGFETRGIISGNLLRQPFLKKFGVSPAEFPNSEYIHTNGFYIGNNHLVSDDDFEWLEECLQDFFE